MSRTNSQWFSLRWPIVWGIGLLGAVGLFFAVRALTTCWRLTALPGLPPATCAGEPIRALEPPVLISNQTTQVRPVIAEPEAPEELDAAEYPAWDGGGRINILFVGLRGESAEEGCAYCTDTLILLTVDPIAKTAGMLSIPRDMWANIPGFGYSRINTAWSLGRRSKLPGGGPDLTMKTVSHFIGVPVDYYVQVDFDTFVDIIDLLGGVDVHNDETIVLDPMSHGKDYPQVKITCCGMRHMNGTVALAYARCRHLEKGCLDGDFGRARRQQKVIFAIRDKVFNPRNFPRLLAQAPELYSSFSSGIRTNLSLDEAIRLAVTVKDIPRENIKNRVIDHTMVSFGRTTLGGQDASVLKPIPDKIRILRDEIFTSGGPVGPLAQGQSISLMLADGARVRVLNGTSTAQLDLQTREYLSGRKVLVTEVGNTKAQNRTTLVLYSPKLYTLRYLVDIFEITRSAQILIQPDSSQTVDIEIRLGNDWVGQLPAGADVQPQPHSPKEEMP